MSMTKVTTTVGIVIHVATWMVNLASQTTFAIRVAARVAPRTRPALKSRS
jgi:hypothetical protein